MREVNAILGEDIFLGRCGEKKATCVVFNVSEWQRTYGEGTVHLIHQRNGDKTPYPCNIVQDGGVVAWVIDLADVAVAGRGRAELQYFVGDALVKSDIYHTATERALGPASEKAPAPYESWMTKMQETANEINENAEEVAQNAQAAKASAEAAAVSEQNAFDSEQFANSYLQDAKYAAERSESAANKASTAREGAQAAEAESQRLYEEIKSMSGGVGATVEYVDSKVKEAVQKSGDTMTGALNLQPNGAGGYAKVYKNASAEGDYGLQMQDVDPDGNFMGLTLSGKLQKLEFKKKRAGESEYRYTKLYDEDNPPSAEDVGALSEAGGTVYGDVTMQTEYSGLTIQSGEGHSTKLMKNGGGDEDYGTILRDTNGDDVAELKLSAANKNVKLAYSGNEYVLYHEGNNPTPDVSGQISNHNTSEEAHEDIREAVNSKAPAYTYGTADLEAGTSALETGKLYFVYE